MIVHKSPLNDNRKYEAPVGITTDQLRSYRKSYKCTDCAYYNGKDKQCTYIDSTGKARETPTKSYAGDIKYLCSYFCLAKATSSFQLF